MPESDLQVQVQVKLSPSKSSPGGPQVKSKRRSKKQEARSKIRQEVRKIQDPRSECPSLARGLTLFLSCSWIPRTFMRTLCIIPWIECCHSSVKCCYSKCRVFLECSLPSTKCCFQSSVESMHHSFKCQVPHTLRCLLLPFRNTSPGAFLKGKKGPSQVYLHVGQTGVSPFSLVYLGETGVSPFSLSRGSCLFSL